MRRIAFVFVVALAGACDSILPYGTPGDILKGNVDLTIVEARDLCHAYYLAPRLNLGSPEPVRAELDRRHLIRDWQIVDETRSGAA